MAMNRDFLARELKRLAFTPADSSGSAPRIGVEVEMLAVDAATGRPCPVASPDSGREAPRATLDWLRPLAACAGWSESRTPKNAPCFVLPDGAVVGFEPGGQIEYSSAPSPSASSVIRSVRSVIDMLRNGANSAGTDLLHAGIDPLNGLEDVQLVLKQPRYVAMDAYFATRGQSGRRMMRQTAATQVAIDLGAPDVMRERWRVLNAMVPCLIAAFANSPRYAGAATGWASYRSHVWRTLDPTRTGIVGTGLHPLDEYLDFALAAPAMFHRAPDGGFPDFETLVRSGDVAPSDWVDHLSTLFPEVRPRGYFEVRCTDAVPVEWMPLVIGTIAGVAYDDRARAAALDLLAFPSPALLVDAGRSGLGDATLAILARDLVEIGLAGCARLGDGFTTAVHREEMHDLFARHTPRGISPGGAEPRMAPEVDVAAELLPL